MEGLPLYIQAKVGVTPPIYPAMEQAVAAMGDRKGLPVALIRRNAGKGRGKKHDLAVLRLSDFYAILAEMSIPFDGSYSSWYSPLHAFLKAE